MDKTSEEPLFKTGTSQEDSFYDTIETSSPDYVAAGAPAEASLTPEEKQAQEEELRKDLAKLEEEIYTLRTVLSAKIRQANELKHKLGISTLSEMKNDVKQGLTNMKQSEVVQKTSETLNHWSESVQQTQAYQKTGTAFKSFGALAAQKFGAMRNSNSFKSFEEKMGGAYTNVKSKMKGSQSEDNFHQTLESPAEENTATNPLAEDTKLVTDEK